MKKNDNEESTKKVIDEYLNGKPKTPEIKRCPFCGGHASLSMRNQPSGSIQFAKCECDNCHAVVGVGQSEISEMVKELCIAKWNRRVSNDSDGDTQI